MDRPQRSRADNAPTRPQARHARSRKVIAHPDVERKMWAVIVGISAYKHESLKLNYADRDAEEFCKVLMTLSRGRLTGDRVQCLTNDKATKDEIRRALRSFLYKPDPEDIVVIYFACHGGRDEHGSNELYLFPYDTDPNGISWTGLPMKDIYDVVHGGILRARRVVIFADTCHSAGIIGARSENVSTAAMNTYLQSISSAKEGIAWLTSAEKNEVSLEDARWDDHGVFTYYLLKGLRGDAQQSKDGVIMVGELFEYVQTQVKIATNNEQHPTIGTGDYDRNLALTFTGEIEAQDHYQLGWHLYQMGWLLDDKGRFESAKRHFLKAKDLAPIRELETQLGRTLVALGEHDEAIRTLKGAIRRDQNDVPPDAYFYLGLAHAKRGDYGEAAVALSALFKQDREIDSVPWAEEYAEWLRGAQSGKKYALLIGIDEYADPQIHKLGGCLTDVSLMEELLIKHFGFQRARVKILTDKIATRKGISDALRSLADNATKDDTVIIFYSGHSVPGDSDPYLVVHDSVTASERWHESVVDTASWGKAKGVSRTIDAKRLHDLITRIPARQKTVILDTHPNSKFLDMAWKEAGYTLLMASSLGELTLEHQFEQGGETKIAGLFTHVLTRQLKKASPEATLGQIMGEVRKEIRVFNPHRSPQTSFLIGMDNELPFTNDVYNRLFDFSQRRNYRALTVEDIQRLYNSVPGSITALFPQLHHSFGLAFIEKHDYAKATHALTVAIRQGEQLGRPYPEARLALAMAQVSAQRYSDARATLKGYLEEEPSAHSSMQEPLATIEQLERRRKHALLIGIDNYLDPSIPDVHGAVNDVRALERVLTGKYGFLPADITVLLNGDAKRKDIMAAFEELVDKARNELALFYFAGNGSSARIPALVSADGRIEGVYDIELDELVALVGNAATNLVSIIDAGWTEYPKEVAARIAAFRTANDNAEATGGRVIAADRRHRPATRYVAVSDDQAEPPPRIGRLTIYHSSIGRTFPTAIEASVPALEGKGPDEIHGVLTYALLRALQEADPNTVTYAQLLETADDSPLLTLAVHSIPAHARRPGWHNLTVEPILTVGEELNEKVFNNAAGEKSVLAALAGILQKPIRQAIDTLERLKQSNSGDPDIYLDLGIAYFLLRDYDNSIEALGHAIYRKGQVPYPEAHYYFGRAQFESKRDLTAAISELGKAIEEDSDNIPAHYYLGMAIRESVEHVTLVKAEQKLQIYLDAGAPLGYAEEVREFLSSRHIGTNTR